MSAIEISNDVFAVGVKDPDLSVFDITMTTRYGTTYNAYLIKGEKIALIDTVKKEFTEKYLANVSSQVPFDKIDYLVVNHTEPDHSGAIPALLEKAPQIKIICSSAAVPYVKNVINQEADITGVKNDHLLELGGKTLQFKLMPYMHWPDTMMDYLQEDKILFSNDGFTAHICSDGLYADELSRDVDLDHETYYYWDCIMRPFSGFIRRNLPKLDDLDIQVLAGSHGPIHRNDARAPIDRYREWTRDKIEDRNSVALFYASNYGNTGKLAGIIAEQLKTNGCEVDMADAASVGADRIKEMIESAKCVVIGTPTFNGDAVVPIWNLVNHFSTVYSIGKKAAVFGSYGWGGEGAKLVAERLKGLKLKLFEEEYRARLIPSDIELTALNEYCAKLAEYIKAGK